MKKNSFGFLIPSSTMNTNSPFGSYKTKSDFQTWSLSGGDATGALHVVKRGEREARERNACGTGNTWQHVEAREAGHDAGP